MSYRAPVGEVRFLLEHVLDYGSQVATLPGLEHADLDTLTDLLGEAAALVEGVVAPLDPVGDRVGSRLLPDGTVETPPGWREAYRALVDGGWAMLDAAPEHGGPGLPHVAQAVLSELLCGACVGFSPVLTLSQGAYHALHGHGSADQQARYLPRLATGEWAGTMCLTEAQAGTDLSLLRTRAEPAADGSYRVTGQKIFITYGDHDLTENIVHLVLARLPDAPPGTRGISLLVVPKVLPDGSPNSLAVVSLEHKMGFHASPTCVLAFDGAYAELVGAPHTGMRSMFTMMNAARLGVGLQGLGIAEAATQAAEAYAATRLQGRAPGGPARPDLEADPIIHHPDVRRMLMRARAEVQPGRALALRAAVAMDIAARHPDAARRQWAADRLALLTPVVKAWLTDLAWSASGDAIQVLGGHGYIVESGVERYARDARITAIWEGTNTIQALDLVRRKLTVDDGRAFRTFLADGRAVAHGLRGFGVDDLVDVAGDALDVLEETAGAVLATGDAEEESAAASDVMRVFQLGAGALLWARMASWAHRSGEGAEERERLARFYAARVLPEQRARAAMATAGAATLR